MRMPNLNLQFIRFIFTGFLSNAFAYVCFLIGVYIFGVGHKTAASILFLIGMSANYIINKNWTFNFYSNSISTMVKFLITYLLGYCFNMVILIIFVDKLDYPPAYVQFLAILMLVFYYYNLNKHFIFKV